MKTGKANYEKGFKKKKRFSLKDGNVICRILPPLGDLADKGVWNRYYSVIWGYKNTEGKMRPFQSTLTKNSSKEVITPDAALERFEDLKARYEKAREEGNGALAAKLNSLVGKKGVYSVDKGYHMNVITLQGEIGTLKIGVTSKQHLDKEINDLRAEGVDPLSSDDGRFFVFGRDTTGVKTTFPVKVYTEKLDVPGVGKVDRPVSHKLTAEILSRLDSETSNLDTLFSKITPEEVAQIVAESDLMTGKSPACNRIFDDRWKAAKAANSNSQPQDKSDDEDGEPEAQVSDPTPAATQASVSAQPTAAAQTLAPAQAPVTAPVAAPAQQATPVQAAPVQQAAPVSAPQTTQAPVTTTSKAQEEMSDDEFFKQMGIEL